MLSVRVKLLCGLCVMFTTVTATNNLNQQTECDKLKESNETWICSEQTECSFLKASTNNEQLLVCGSDKTDRRVCCPRRRIKKKKLPRRRTAKACDKLKNETASWICKSDWECPHLEELKSSKLIVRCSSENTPPKLCCPEPRFEIDNTSTTSEDPSTHTLPNIDLKFIIPADPNSVVLNRCTEYAKYRYVNETHQPIVLGQKPYNKSRLECIEIESLTVGSSRVEEREYPHMAALGYGENSKSVTWTCSGSLISEKFILSAAHCRLRPYIGTVKWAALGLIRVTDATSDKLNSNLFRVIRSYTYPANKLQSQQHNDIALYQIEKPITFTTSIRPVCLLTVPKIPKTVGDLVYVSGWGRDDEDQTQVLLKSEIALVNRSVCMEHYKGVEGLKKGFDEQTMICAGKVEDDRETCEGDSGGPLQIPLEAYPCMWLQIGLTSFSSQNCSAPGIFTKISFYVPWIQNIVWPQ